MPPGTTAQGGGRQAKGSIMDDSELHGDAVGIDWHRSHSLLP